MKVRYEDKNLQRLERTLIFVQSGGALNLRGPTGVKFRFSKLLTMNEICGE